MRNFTIYPKHLQSINCASDNKRYPLYLWNAIESAVHNIDEIPEDQKDLFVSLVGDRATVKKIPRAGWHAALLPKAILNKYPELKDYMISDYNRFLPVHPDEDVNVLGMTLEEALLEIYEAMKSRWFPA